MCWSGGECGTSVLDLDHGAQDWRLGWEISEMVAVIGVYSTIKLCVVAALTVSVESLNIWLSPHTRYSAGEVCTSWQTWSEYFGIPWIFLQSLLQSLIYIALAVRLATVSSHQILTFSTDRFQWKCSNSCKDIRPIVSVFFCQLSSFLSMGSSTARSIQEVCVVKVFLENKADNAFTQFQKSKQ